MGKIIVLLLSVLLVQNESFSKSSSNSLICSSRDQDYMFVWRGHPKCRRHVPGWLKSEVYDHYGIPESERRLYTVDHRVPLGFGGSNSFVNLCPQLRSESTARYEYQLYLRVKHCELTPEEAQEIILDFKGPCRP